MSRWLASLTLLFLAPVSLALFSMRARAAGPCLRHVVREFEYIAGHDVKVLRLEDAPVRHGVIRVKDLFGKKDEVLLGVGGDHAFLYVDGVRYDGDVYYANAGEVRSRVTTVEPGVLIRFKDLSPSQVANLRAQLLKKAGTKIRSATCFHGACSELSRAGIHVQGGVPFLPGNLYERLITSGFVDAEGKPLEVEIYQTAVESVTDSLESVQALQSEELIAQGVRGTFYTVAIAGGGFAVYYVEQKIVRSKARR